MLGVKGSVGVMWGGEGNVVEVFYFPFVPAVVCRVAGRGIFIRVFRE